MKTKFTMATIVLGLLFNAYSEAATTTDKIQITFSIGGDELARINTLAESDRYFYGNDYRLVAVNTATGKKVIDIPVATKDTIFRKTVSVNKGAGLNLEFKLIEDDHIFDDVIHEEVIKLRPYQKVVGQPKWQAEHREMVRKGLLNKGSCDGYIDESINVFNEPQECDLFNRVLSIQLKRL